MAGEGRVFQVTLSYSGPASRIYVTFDSGVYFTALFSYANIPANTLQVIEIPVAFGDLFNLQSSSAVTVEVLRVVQI